MALHQIGHIHFLALVEPVFLLVRQGAAQEVTGAVKAQNGQAALFGAAARRRVVVKQLFFAQHGVHRLGQGGSLARPQAPVVAKKPRHDGVCGVVKFESESDEFRTGVEQGFWVHRLGLSHV